MAAPGEVLAQAGQAFDLLMSPATPQAQRTQVDAWLQALRERHEAWLVCDAFLALEPQASKETAARVIFAALTLQYKISEHLAQLPAASVESLRLTMLRHIVRFSSLGAAAGAAAAPGAPRAAEGGFAQQAAAHAPTNAQRNLCQAYASLIVQVGAPPDRALAELCGALPLPEGALAVLEVLRALPDEIDRSKRREAGGDSRGWRVCFGGPKYFVWFLY